MFADTAVADQTVAAIAVLIARVPLAIAGRVVALEVIAGTTRGGGAVAIGAAFAADVGRLTEAAEEAVAAVVLSRGSAARAGDIEDTARLFEWLAAADFVRDALSVAAGFALAACAVAHVVFDAAEGTGTANVVRAALRFRVVAALGVLAPDFAIRACAARLVDAVMAFPTVVIGAALTFAFGVAVVAGGAIVVADWAAMPVCALSAFAALLAVAAFADALGIAILAIRTELIPRWAAMAVGAFLVAALFVVAASTFHGVVALLRFRTEIGKGNAGSVLAGAARVAIGGFDTAVVDGLARAAGAGRAGGAVCGRAAVGFRVIAGAGLLAIFLAGWTACARLVDAVFIAAFLVVAAFAFHRAVAVVPIGTILSVWRAGIAHAG